MDWLAQLSIKRKLMAVMLVFGLAASAILGDVIYSTQDVEQRFDEYDQAAVSSQKYLLSIESVSWIAAPMIVTTQGSGSFNYVGLFKAVVNGVIRPQKRRGSTQAYGSSTPAPAGSSPAGNPG